MILGSFALRRPLERDEGTRSVTCAGNYDLVIRNGTVVDGTGRARFGADVGVRDGLIACVGTIERAEGERVLDAAGHVVAPGFVDVHVHVERNLPDSAPFKAPNFTRQGVTTVITGNCGSSSLSVREVLDRLDRYGAQLNVATLVGHNSVRRRVMERADRTPNPREMDEMRQLVANAMDEGALGLSTGLAYVPGTYAKGDEVVELARVAAERGGLYVSHVRDEGLHGYSAIKEALEIGERAGLPVHVSHFKASGRSQWGASQLRLSLIDEALRKGQRITIDQYPYVASSTSLDLMLPRWALAEDAGRIAQRLRDPATRARVRTEMIAQLRNVGWQDYSFARVAYCPSDLGLNGKTIPQIAASLFRPIVTRKADLRKSERAVDVSQELNAAVDSPAPQIERQADAILDLMIRGGAQMIYFDMAEADLLTIMAHQDTMFGSDSAVRTEDTKAVPHPRGSGTFPRVLARYVREAGVLKLEEAVRRMTSLPAQTFGLSGRGRIVEGHHADIVIFRENEIVDRATYDDPLAAPAGVSYVLVNGSIVLERDRPTDAVPGMAIRRTSRGSGQTSRSAR